MSFVLLGILNAQAAGAGGAGAYDLLETVTPTGVSSVSFTGLGSYTDYKHLQIRATVRGDATGAQQETVFMRLNGATSGYAWHRLYAFNSSLYSENGTSQNKIELAKTPGASAQANRFANVVTDIFDFASTAKNTTTRTLSGHVGGAVNRMGLRSGLFNNTAAITTIELLSEGSNWTTGTRFSLMGIKG